jgi:hypothetical protein
MFSSLEGYSNFPLARREAPVQRHGSITLRKMGSCHADKEKIRQRVEEVRSEEKKERFLLPGTSVMVHSLLNGDLPIELVDPKDVPKSYRERELHLESDEVFRRRKTQNQRAKRRTHSWFEHYKTFYNTDKTKECEKTFVFSTLNHIELHKFRMAFEDEKDFEVCINVPGDCQTSKPLLYTPAQFDNSIDSIEDLQEEVKVIEESFGNFTNLAHAGLMITKEKELIVDPEGFQKLPSGSHKEWYMAAFNNRDYVLTHENVDDRAGAEWFVPEDDGQATRKREALKFGSKKWCELYFQCQHVPYRKDKRVTLLYRKVGPSKSLKTLEQIIMTPLKGGETFKQRVENIFEGNLNYLDRALSMVEKLNVREEEVQIFSAISMMYYIVEYELEQKKLNARKEFAGIKKFADKISTGMRYVNFNTLTK